MTADEYVRGVLAKYAVQRGPESPAEQLGAEVAGPIRAWAGPQLSRLTFSGSYAKHTGVAGVADVDIFVSLKADTQGTLMELYESLFRLADARGWGPRRQNVSIGVTLGGTRADLVPGRVQTRYRNYHSLYVRKRDSWTQTNVALHTDTVLRSGRLDEIRAVKIWRRLQGLDFFPSLHLELFVIQALSGRSKTTLAANVLHAVRAIRSSLITTRIVDPANSNNVLSDLMTDSEQEFVVRAAGRAAAEPYWENIIS